MYAQSLMRPRLLIAVLALTLSGTNTAVASMCAAYCMSAAFVGAGAAHHHRMESYSHHHTADCAECPPDTGNSLNQKPDCSRLLQIQALKEGSLSLAAPSGVSPIQAVDTPVRALALASDGTRFSPLKAPPKIRSLHSASAPLRI